MNESDRPETREIKRMNQTSWDYANEKFNSLKGDYEKAIRSGAEVLPPEVINQLNPTESEEVLHLMCNDGREAAYLSHEFDCRVWGIDFSSPAIEFAERINEKLELDNQFINENIFDWLSTADKNDFDKVLTTLGSIRWIYEKDQFFRLARSQLRENGSMLIWDFHPIVKCLDSDMKFAVDYPLDSYSFIRDEGVRDYVSSESKYTLVSRNPDSDLSSYENTNSVYFTHHSIPDLITSGLENGFTLSSFEEYGFLWEEKYLPWLEEVSPRRYEAPDSTPQVPLTFVIKLENS